jgi:hypothetical protein
MGHMARMTARKWLLTTYSRLQRPQEFHRRFLANGYPTFALNERQGRSAPPGFTNGDHVDDDNDFILFQVYLFRVRPAPAMTTTRRDDDQFRSYGSVPKSGQWENVRA